MLLVDFSGQCNYPIDYSGVTSSVEQGCIQGQSVISPQIAYVGWLEIDKKSQNL
jgi:hypothetical protein